MAIQDATLHSVRRDKSIFIDGNPLELHNTTKSMFHVQWTQSLQRSEVGLLKRKLTGMEEFVNLNLPRTPFEQIHYRPVEKPLKYGLEELLEMLENGSAKRKATAFVTLKNYLQFNDERIKSVEDWLSKNEGTALQFKLYELLASVGTPKVYSEELY